MHEFKVGAAVMARSNVAGTPDIRLGPSAHEVETDTRLTWEHGHPKRCDQ